MKKRLFGPLVASLALAAGWAVAGPASASGPETPDGTRVTTTATEESVDPLVACYSRPPTHPDWFWSTFYWGGGPGDACRACIADGIIWEQQGYDAWCHEPNFNGPPVYLYLRL